MNLYLKFIEDEAKRLPFSISEIDKINKNCQWGDGAVTDSKKFPLDIVGREFVHTFSTVHNDLIARCLKAGHTRNMTGELVRHLGDGVAWFRVSSF